MRTRGDIKANVRSITLAPGLDGRAAKVVAEVGLLLDPAGVKSFDEEGSRRHRDDTGLR